MSDANEIRRILEKSGYKDIPQDLLNDFMNALKEEEDESVNSVNVEEEEVEEYRPLRRQVPRKTISPAKKIQKKESSSPKRNLPPPEPIERVPVKKTKRVQVAEEFDDDNNENDDETEEFENRIKALKLKASELDQTLRECRDVVLSPADDEDNQGALDVPMYYGTSERKLDPYPAVKKELAGGFIRPPPVKPSKKPVGANKKKGKRLLYEERHPESSYVPPPERRRDSLRWSIRQKLVYSHPDYHK